MTTKKMIQMSAMFAAFASASFAQGGLKASIDFPFLAQGVTMQPGTYNLSPANNLAGRPLYVLRNEVSNRAVLISSGMLSAAKANAAPAVKLVFKCVGKSECSLAQIWNGSDKFVEIAVPRRKTDSEENILEVAMTRAPVRVL